LGAKEVNKSPRGTIFDPLKAEQKDSYVKKQTDFLPYKLASQTFRFREPELVSFSVSLLLCFFVADL